MICLDGASARYWQTTTDVPPFDPLLASDPLPPWYLVPAFDALPPFVFVPAFDALLWPLVAGDRARGMALNKPCVMCSSPWTLPPMGP
jgi:hypothetical protein